MGPVSFEGRDDVASGLMSLTNPASPKSASASRGAD
jgi:hypothetical protein